MCLTPRVQAKTKSTMSRLALVGGNFHLNDRLAEGLPVFMCLKPVSDQKIWRPVAWMAVTTVAEEFDLSRLQGPGFGNRRRPAQLFVKFLNQRGGGLIVYKPQAGQSATRAGFDRDSGKSKRVAVI